MQDYFYSITYDDLISSIRISNAELKKQLTIDPKSLLLTKKQYNEMIKNTFYQ